MLSALSAMPALSAFPLQCEVVDALFLGVHGMDAAALRVGCAV